MSITNTFDIHSEAVISPNMLIRPVEGFPEVVVSTFQDKAYDLLLRTGTPELLGELRAGRTVPVYKIKYRNRELALYHSLLGGSASGNLLEEIIAMGGRKILLFGSCGSLDQSISAGHYIVPSAAYRDEGTSYHYAPPGDYIEVKTADRLARLFEEIDIPYIKGRVWTTDSFYRETRSNMAARKADGCVAVEMECASVMAVAQFRGVEAFQFLYAADSLDETEWDPRILGKMPDDMREKHVRIALELAYRL